MSASIREQIRAVDDRAEKIVDIPEWGVKLLLISPTSRERTAMMGRYVDVVANPETGEQDRVLNTQAMMPSLVVACAHDPETRERAFDDGDAEWLADKNGAVVERLGMDCMPLAGFTQPDDESPADTGKDDSSTTPVVDTRSDSPAPSDEP